MNKTPCSPCTSSCLLVVLNYYITDYISVPTTVFSLNSNQLTCESFIYSFTCIMHSFCSLPVLYNLIPILCIMIEAASVKWINSEKVRFKRKKVSKIVLEFKYSYKKVKIIYFTFSLFFFKNLEWVLAYANK